MDNARRGSFTTRRQRLNDRYLDQCTLIIGLDMTLLQLVLVEYVPVPNQYSLVTGKYHFFGTPYCPGNTLSKYHTSNMYIRVSMIMKVRDQPNLVNK